MLNRGLVLGENGAGYRLDCGLSRLTPTVDTCHAGGHPPGLIPGGGYFRFVTAVLASGQLALHHHMGAGSCW